jgi:hypothetical protein
MTSQEQLYVRQGPLAPRPALSPNNALQRMPLLRLTKRRIALIQMEQSLNMLEAGDPVSALTLAGAAEEILGRAAARKGKEPRVEYFAEWSGSNL